MVQILVSVPQSMQVFVAALAAVVLCSALCTAAPRFNIPVIPRKQAKEDVLDQIRVPSRDPFPAFQGPFADDIEYRSCVQNERELEPGKVYILDLCVLQNVTLSSKMTKEVEEVELDMNGDVSELRGQMEDGGDAKLEGTATEENSEADVFVILGVFRGWLIDPITLRYKYMIYDDGDKCKDDDHYSIQIELVPSANPKSDTKLVGLKKTSMCKFEASLLTYVPKEARVAEQGIHTPGVIDISSAEASLPMICGKMKCRYEKIAKQVRDLSDQIRDVRAWLVTRSSTGDTLFTNMTLEASKNTLQSAIQVVEKSLELFRKIEDQQRSLTNNFPKREEAAKKEIAEQDEEAKKRKDSVEAIRIAGNSVEEQNQMAAAS